MAEKYLHETIEKYLLGELPPADSARLEADMATDPQLYEQVEIQRLALIGMQRLAAADMYERFAKWDEEIDTPLPSSSSPPASGVYRARWKWSAITLLLLLLAGAFWHFRQIGKLNDARQQEQRELTQRDSLYAALRLEYQQKEEALDTLMKKGAGARDSLSQEQIKHLQEELKEKDKALRAFEVQSAAGRQFALNEAPKAPNMKTRGNGENEDPILGAAKESYTNSDFKEAIRLLKSIPPDDNRQVQVTKLLPYALFYSKRYEEAIPAFTRLWEQNEEFEAMNAQGYLLLCYIAEGKYSEARQMRLIILQNPNHKFYQTAKDATSILRNS